MENSGLSLLGTLYAAKTKGTPGWFFALLVFAVFGFLWIRFQQRHPGIRQDAPISVILVNALFIVCGAGLFVAMATQWD